MTNGNRLFWTFFWIVLAIITIIVKPNDDVTFWACMIISNVYNASAKER